MGFVCPLSKKPKHDKSFLLMLPYILTVLKSVLSNLKHRSYLLCRWITNYWQALWYIFTPILAAQKPSLAHWQGNNLTQCSVITVLAWVGDNDNEVESQSEAEHPVKFWLMWFFAIYKDYFISMIRIDSA